MNWFKTWWPTHGPGPYLLILCGCLVLVGVGYGLKQNHDTKIETRKALVGPGNDCGSLTRLRTPTGWLVTINRDSPIFIEDADGAWEMCP